MDQQELEQILQPSPPERETTRAAILTDDPVNRRLLEGLTLQLGLDPITLSTSEPSRLPFPDYEMILADEAIAHELRAQIIAAHHGSSEDQPALVALRVRSPQDNTGLQPPVRDSLYEGILSLPDQPSLVSAQLGVILYAHRAYVRRYKDAMEELNLNRRIFRSVTSGITVARASEDLPLVYVNPAFEAISGFSIEESLGKNCRFLQRGLRDQPGLTLVREALRAGREGKAIVRNFRKDGTPFWNELAISPIHNHEGKLTHFVGIQQDVTSRVEFEEALRESEKLATAGRLAASIAHEINNPLEAITNLIYLARHSPDLPTAESHLSLADAELRRVALLTSQSLRFYKQSTAPQAVKPSDLLDSVLDVYARRLQSMNIHVEKREHTCDSVVCFESELRQVISNLVRNGMDAMRVRGGRLLVRTREASDLRRDQKGVLLTVADTGTGMSREVQARIFDAFYSTKGNSGTGLGLWISREIILRHRGNLRVRSSDVPGNSWTVFELFLPYQGLVP